MSNKSKIKIVFVNYLPITKKTEKDYYLDALLNDGFSVSYWDLTDIFFKDLIIVDKLSADYSTCFSSYKELEKEIRKIDIMNTVFIVQITYERRVLKLYRLFSKYDCKIYRFYIGAMPDNYTSTLIIKIKNNLNFKVFLKLIDKLLPKIYLKSGLVKGYDIVFIAGNVARDMFYKKAKTIDINLFDYDKYLVLRDNKNSLIKEKYCVYIDDNWAFHPDVEMLGLPPLDPVRHIESLNNFFCIIEKLFNLKVIIAAHPKSDHQQSLFQNRQIYKNKSAELIKNCEFTIVSVSTALSYAVCFAKKIIFVYTDEIKEKYRHDLYLSIINYANYLGETIVNVNDFKIPDIVLAEVDRVKYDEYMYNYVTSKETENQLSADIVLNHFRSLDII